MSSLTDNEESCQANGESEIEVLLGQALADCNDCLNRGDFPGALQLLDRAIDLSPGNPEILTHRGRLLLFLKEFDRARTDFEEALQADSRCAATHSGLARCHFEKRAYDLARTCATRARTVDPANQEAGDILSALEKTTGITERPVPANAPAPDRYGGHQEKLFAKTDPQFSEDLLAGLRGRRLAIIGNATVTRDFGSLIDTYDAVIRLNNFRLAGFEPLVGTRTDFRCTTGFTDIEHRNEHPEFSPFRDNALESTHLATFNRANARPVLSAQLDVHPFISETRNPSTGLALVQLCAQLGLSADLFGFDGFKSPHYWQLNANFRTTHSRHELAIILRRPNVILFGETYPYAALYDFCHANHRDYDDNVGLKLLHRLGRTFRGKTILEFGAGNGELSRYLEAQTNRVTAVEVSGHAFVKIQCTRKIHGDAFTLALLREHFDVFASVDVLEHLTENDIRLVLREAGRLADSLFLSVSTRPSGLLGPNGENLHLTVRPAQWWVEEAGRYFDVRLSNGYGTGQIVLEGRVKSHRPAAGIVTHTLPVVPSDYCLKPGYQSRPRPLYFEDTVTEEDQVVWQPDVYPLAAQIARKLGCRHIVDVGCGRAHKLVQLQNEFETLGVDFGSNLEFCRRHHPQGEWIEVDFEKSDGWPLLARQATNAVVICADRRGQFYAEG